MNGLDIIKARAFLGGGGGSGGSGVGVKVTPLTVTENGTYTAESGMAYSPVTVNVAAQGGGGDLDALIDRSITEVHNNANKVGTYAFYSCTKLITVDFPNATSAESRAFENCSALKSLNIPNAYSIGMSAFANCSGLESVELPKVSEILGSAFKGCGNLKTVDIHSTVSLTGASFSGCNVLNSFILRSSEVSTLLATNVFTSTNLKIYVPSALVDTYKAATNWSTYASRFRALEDYTVDGTIYGEMDWAKMAA